MKNLLKICLVSILFINMPGLFPAAAERGGGEATVQEAEAVLNSAVEKAKAVLIKNGKLSKEQKNKLLALGKLSPSVYWLYDLRSNLGDLSVSINKCNDAESSKVSQWHDKLEDIIDDNLEFAINFIIGDDEELFNGLIQIEKSIRIKDKQINYNNRVQYWKEVENFVKGQD